MHIQVQNITYPFYYVITPENDEDTAVLVRLIPDGMGINKRFRIIRDQECIGGGYFEFIPAGLNITGDREKYSVTQLPELWEWLSEYIDSAPAPVFTL